MRPSHPKSAQRGSALLVAMGVALVLATLVTALFVFAGAERNRAIRLSRRLTRADCVQSGLLLARAYFSQDMSKWNSYLADPAHYNPVSVSGLTAADLDAGLAAGGWSSVAPFNRLFYDLDGDGQPDVYIYIRDNQDEISPAVNNWEKDNDQNVIVGAVCISKTLTPLLPDGQVDTSKLTAESLLSYNTPGNNYSGQSGGGASGTGNIN